MNICFLFFFKRSISSGFIYILWIICRFSNSNKYSTNINNIKKKIYKKSIKNNNEFCLNQWIIHPFFTLTKNAIRKTIQSNSNRNINAKNIKIKYFAKHRRINNNQNTQQICPNKNKAKISKFSLVFEENEFDD